MNLAVRGRTLLANLAITLSPITVVLQIVPQKAATGIKPEIGHALSKPLAFSRGCPAFSFSLEYRAGLNQISAAP